MCGARMPSVSTCVLSKKRYAALSSAALSDCGNGFCGLQARRRARATRRRSRRASPRFAAPNSVFAQSSISFSPANLVRRYKQGARKFNIDATRLPAILSRQIPKMWAILRAKPGLLGERLKGALPRVPPLAAGYNFNRIWSSARLPSLDSGCMPGPSLRPVPPWIRSSLWPRTPLR